MIEAWEKSYLQTLKGLLHKAELGGWKQNRTQYRTVGGFGLQLDVPLTHGSLPAMVSKTVHLKSLVAELCWFLRGETNVAWLHDHGCTIWDEWADAKGDLGPVYGAQWRSWWTQGGRVDQIAQLLHDLRSQPYSRRMIVSAWNVADLPTPDWAPHENASNGLQALAPCHLLFQAYVEDLTLEERLQQATTYGVPEELVKLQVGGSLRAITDVLNQYGVPTRGLALRVDQRSADWFLGVPFNIASYGLLAQMLCRAVPNLMPTKLVMQFGDYHLYENQVEVAREQIDRYVRLTTGEEAPAVLQYPKVAFPNDLGDFSQVTPEDIVVTDYRPWGRIVAPPPAV